MRYMQGFPSIKKHAIITVILLLVVYAGTVICTGFRPAVSVRPGITDSLYAGTDACLSCHRAVHDSFSQTSHFLTSRPAAAQFIKGSFDSGHNDFRYNPFMDVKLEKKENGFFQTVYINGEQSRAESMDIVVGSGKKGQTYLYWKENLLYQLPVSYYVPTKSWCNSPGYPAGLPRFTRLIPARCLECHGSRATYEDAGNNVNYIDRNSIVYGVDCERCHGPAAKHVAYQQAHPGDKTAHHILAGQDMTRQQKLDLCALCHSGIRKPVQPVFSFVAGNRLSDFSLPKYSPDSAAQLDVHGNQYGLLSSSKCFIQSDMTCSSCHNVHQKESNRPALFSSRCLNCHNGSVQPVCSVTPAKNMVLADNCIDCHMPSLASRAIFLQMADKDASTPDYVRSHRVAVYPDIARKIIKAYQSGKFKK